MRYEKPSETIVISGCTHFACYVGYWLYFECMWRRGTQFLHNVVTRAGRTARRAGVSAADRGRSMPGTEPPGELRMLSGLSGVPAQAWKVWLSEEERVGRSGLGADCCVSSQAQFKPKGQEEEEPQMTSLTDSTAWLSVSLVDQHEKLLSTQVSVYRGAGMSWSFCKNAQHKLF